jgi:hypothetical protein
MGANMFLENQPDFSIHSKKKVKVICDECGSEFERRYDSLCSCEKHRCYPCSVKHRTNLLKGKKRPLDVIKKAQKKKAETWKERYPNLNIICKYCQKSFTVPYRDRDRLYCCRSCQSKSINRSDIRKTSKCIICKKEFKHYGDRIICSLDCNAKYMSITRIGENNPAFKEKKDVRTCLACKKDFVFDRGGMHKGQTRVFCSLACAHNIDLKGCSQSGFVNKYPFEWNEKLRTKIKERDNFQCQLCGKKESKPKHHVHHIDYDKSNLDEENLITLCRNCHNFTHKGRSFWEVIFAGLISGSKIVKKPWGAEIHIVNHNEYCLKYLIFFKGMQFSYHWHPMKKELWHCLYGKFECVLEKNNGHKEYFIFKQGDKVEIDPKIKHQLQAIKNSILVEVSTRDYPEDSIRDIEGHNC